jgi:hypothetical protein
MKKVIFEKSLRALIATCCFLLLGVVAVSAQGKLTSVAVVPGVEFPPNPGTPVYDVPQGVFVSNAAASTILENELVKIKNDLTNAQNDPAVFNALLVKYRYFGRIAEHIQAGATTPNAIAAGLWIFLESAEYASISASTQQALKDEAIDLLK